MLFEPDWRPLFARVKRAKEHCSGRELAVLKELAEARESIACKLDLPPFKTIPDETLIELTKRPPKSEAELAKRRGMHPYCRGRGAAVLVAAIRKGLSGPKLSWSLPPRGGRRSRQSPELMERLKAWRAEMAERHDVEPDVILSMNAIRMLAAGASVASVLGEEPVRKWGEGDVQLALERLIGS